MTDNKWLRLCDVCVCIVYSIAELVHCFQFCVCGFFLDVFFGVGTVDTTFYCSVSVSRFCEWLGWVRLDFIYTYDGEHHTQVYIYTSNSFHFNAVMTLKSRTLLYNFFFISLSLLLHFPSQSLSPPPSHKLPFADWNSVNVR